MLGTAFFVDSDSMALTNTHVVYLARQNPAGFRLLAIVRQEFYSAVLVCAAALPYDPEKEPVVLSRDIAVVQRSVPFPFTHLRYGQGGPSMSRTSRRCPISRLVPRQRPASRFSGADCRLRPV